MEGMMKRLVLMDKGGPWKLEEVPIPEPGVGQILCKVLKTSVCNQTDLNTIRALHPPHDYQTRGMVPHHMRMWDKDHDLKNDPLAKYYNTAAYDRPPYPTTMGHEGMGVIVKMGPQMEEVRPGRNSSFKVGDRVGLIGCESALGQYVIANPDMLCHVPDNITDEEASLSEPSLVPWSMTRSVIHNDDDVVILGQGALGLLATQWCRIRGARRIITSDPNPMKREYSKKFGADYVLDPTTQNITAEVERITNGRLCDVALECAGVPETIQNQPYLLKGNGRIGQIGACCVPVYCDWGYIHFRGIYVCNSGSNPYAEFSSDLEKWDRGLEEAADAKARGLLNLQDMITHRLKLTVEDINALFTEIAEKGTVIKAVVDPWAE